jgi:hypothetical protein
VTTVRSIQDARKRTNKAKTPVNGDDSRPPIRVSAELHSVTDKAVDALGADDLLYQRDGQLVRVLRIAESEKQASELVGMPAIRSAGMATVRERLTAVANWERWDGRSESYKPTTPPDAVVQAVAARGQYPRVRPLTGIIEAPFLRPDGTVCETPGYDSATGFLLIPEIEFPPVPQSPTLEDAIDALSVLQEPFEEFPFKSEADRMVSVAALLTLLARPALGNVPSFVTDANTAGAGKTLSTDAVAIIATGRPVAKMTWSDDPAELEKVLGSFALMGAPIVAFDNVSSAFGGASLDKVLTCGGRVQLRVLGRSETPMVPWKATVFATGNNLVITGDTARRVLKPRLESADERPEDRADFKHADLLGYCKANRARFVTAALTLLRAWVVAGRPRCGCKTWGSFEEWAAMIPPAISFAGGDDPMQCRLSELGEESPEKAALRIVIEFWPKLAPMGMTIKTALAVLYPADCKGYEPNDGMGALREAIEVLAPTMPGKQPAGRKLGDEFRHLKGKIVGNAKLVGKPDRNGVMVWRVCAGSEGSCGVIPNPSRANSQTVSRDPVEKDPATPRTPRSGDERLPFEPPDDPLFDGVNFDEF